MKTALIVGGGPVSLRQLQRELATNSMLVIATDRGGEYLKTLGFSPQFLVGDFDSIKPGIEAELAGQGVKVIGFPVAKDETDLELAIELALQEQVTSIRILGALGGRIDHSLANMGLLWRTLDAGCEARLIDEHHEIMLIEKEIAFTKKIGQSLSLIPMTPKVKGITTTGLRFPLVNEELFIYQTRGIHNEFVSEEARIRIEEGRLIVILFDE